MRPAEDEMAESILRSIRLVKDRRALRAGEVLTRGVQALFARGAATVILTCTETPVAGDAIGSPLRSRCVDANRALART